MKTQRSSLPSRYLPWRALSACVVLLLASLTPTVHAACSPILPPPVRYVGPMGVGSQCTDATIQEAIDNSTCAYGTTIYVSPYGLGGTRTYSNQHLTIFSKNVTLIGESGTYGCGSPPPYCGEMFSDPNNCLNVTGPVITLDGNNADFNVVKILGNSNVSIKYLEIKRGNVFGNGGGIRFFGAGTLSLLNSSVLSNRATYGGGIDVETWNGDATLNLYDNVAIGSNTASESGGGVRIQGSSGHTAFLNAWSPNLGIVNNEATNKYGGGVEIVGKATANIGASGTVITANRAVHGGGIAVLAGQNAGENAALNLFSTNANAPVGVTGNTATNTGGGIFLKPYLTEAFVSSAGASANLWDFKIDGNDAQNGAAIYGDVYDTSVLVPTAEGVVVKLNRGARPPGGVACTESSSCNSISGNRAVDANGNRTEGSVLLMQDESSLDASRFRLENNIADHAIHHLNTSGSQVGTHLSECLIANNDLAKSSVLRFAGAGVLHPPTVTGCTIANNVIAGNTPNTYVVDVTGTDVSGNGVLVGLFANIFAQPSVNTKSLRLDRETANATYNLAREISTLGSGIGNFPGNANFVNAAAKNYRLLPGSLGVDYAPAVGGLDLAGNPRDVDLESVSNLYGSRDLGAFELGCQSTYFAGALCSLDVDGDNNLETTDAQMMLRRLFGFKAVSLRAGLPPAGSCAQRTSVTALDAFVQSQLAPQLALSNRAAWDIDGNGKVEALTDGLLVLRALLGLTGNSVTQNAIGNNNPARPDWTSVRTYLNNTCGMTLP